MATEKVKLDVTFLAHHGVTGQKWGVRRYQEKDGSLTPEGRQHWGIGPAREKIKLAWKNRKVFRPKTEAEKKKLLKAKEAKKAENEKKREENAAKRAERNKAALDAKREKLIREGDPKTLYKNRKLLSDEDLDRALNRINKLGTLKPEDKAAQKSLQQTKENRQTVKDGKSSVDKLIAGGKTAVTVAGTLVGMYEGYAKVASIVNEITGKDTLPTFDLSPWKKKDSGKEKSIEDQIKDALGQNKGSKDKNNKGQNQNKGDQQSKKESYTWNPSAVTQGGKAKYKGEAEYYTTESPFNFGSGNFKGKTTVFDLAENVSTVVGDKLKSGNAFDLGDSDNTFLNVVSAVGKSKNVAFDDLVYKEPESDYDFVGSLFDD